MVSSVESRGTLYQPALVVMCAALFFFTLQAKTGDYARGFSHNLDPATSVKLCLDGETSRVALPPLSCVWLASSFILALGLRRNFSLHFLTCAVVAARFELQRIFDRFPPSFSF
jgi:hypothetical protein